jgi:hypothetical protein
MIKKIYTSDPWKNGKFVDLWSIGHFILGMLLAYAIPFLEIRFSWAFFTALLIMFLWELFEVFAKIKETMTNRIIDILLGLLGFLLIIPLFSHVGQNTLIVIFVFLLGSSGILLIFGNRAHRARKKLIYYG